jgi:hypothetical protein
MFCLSCREAWAPRRQEIERNVAENLARIQETATRRALAAARLNLRRIEAGLGELEV